MAEAQVEPKRLSGIAYNDRVFAVGMTGSGKSELINHLLSPIRCQRLLLDVKDECQVAGVEKVSSIEAIDWRRPFIHYVPGSGDLDEIGELFGLVYQRRHIVVAAHELADLCEFHPSATPRAVRDVLNKGRARGQGVIGGSQVPVCVPRHALTEARHLFIFAVRLSPDHHKTIAKTMGMDHGELGATLDELLDRQGEHAFLWWDRKTRELAECPPLPDHLRKRSVVKLVDLG